MATFCVLWHSILGGSETEEESHRAAWQKEASNVEGKPGGWDFLKDKCKMFLRRRNW